MEGYDGIVNTFEVPSGEDFKRTIVKPAPTCFTVEVLPPAKHGKAHSFGVRVIPVSPQQLRMFRDAEDGTPDTMSVRSIGQEYEIWRRWDDCLDFQYKLEIEFERMSREKKRVLRSSKTSGGTLYSNPKAGASFESLPEGPDPKNVKIDLHAYVPRLTKKATFFSASDATVQKRAEEFACMIYGLFKADCVKLMEELRDSTVVREFFAWWRRDEDRVEKLPRRPGSALSNLRPVPPSRSDSRASINPQSSTVFTMPPSPDSPGFSMLKRQEKMYVHPQRSPTDMSSPTATSPSSSVASPRMRPNHLPSPPTSPEQHFSRSPFYGRPGVQQQPLSINRPMEQLQFNNSAHAVLAPQMAHRPRTSPVPAAAPSRGGRLFDARELRQARGTQQGDASSDSSTPPVTPTRATFSPDRVRERPVSQMSMETIDSVDLDIDLSFIRLEPAPTGAGKMRANVMGKRDSIASISSFMSVDSTRTTDSMDGVLPRAVRRQTRVSQRPRRRRNGPWSPDSRLSLAVPEDYEAEQYYSDDGLSADGEADELDSAFDDTMSYLDSLDAFPGVPAPPPGSDDDAMRQYTRDREWRMSFPTSIRDSIINSEFDFYDVTEPSSPTSTIHGIVIGSEGGHSTHSSGSNGTIVEPGMCSVKAKYDDTIIALRLPLGTPLSTLRARLSEKFLQAQGVQLHYRFALAYAPPRRLGADEGMPILLSPAALEFEGSAKDPRASTVHARDSGVFGASTLMRLVPIWSQDDWEIALQTCSNKVVLHIIEQNFSG